MKLRRAYVMGLVALLGTQATRAEDKIALIPKWNAGDVRHMTLTEDSDWSATGDAAKVIAPKMRSVKQFKMEILSKDKDGFIIKWELLSYVLGSLDEDVRAMKPAPEALYFYKSSPKIRVSANGEVNTLENRAEIAAEIREKMIDNAMRAQGPDGKTREEIEKMLDKIEQGFDVTTLITEDVNQFLSVMGQTYTEKPQSTEQKLVLKITKFNMKSTFKSTAAVRNGVASVYLGMEPADDAVAREIVSEAILDYRKQKPSATDLTKVEFLQETNAEIELATGWPKKVVYKRHAIKEDKGGSVTSNQEHTFVVSEKPPETQPAKTP